MILDGPTKMCAGHYHDLAAALRKKNLWFLVAQESSERERRAQEWLKGTAKFHEFDPLVVSMLEITQKCRMLVSGGLPMGCSLCNAMKLLNDERVPEAWIDNITDLMVVTARINGLMRDGREH